MTEDSVLLRRDTVALDEWHPVFQRIASTFLSKGHVIPAVLWLYDAWHSAMSPEDLHSATSPEDLHSATPPEDLHSATSPEDLNPTVHILSAVQLWGSSS